MSVVRYRRNPAAVWRASHSFLVAAVPPRPPTTVVGSAAMVWVLLEQPLTLHEIVSRLVEASQADAATVRRDTETLVADLVPTGLVEEMP